MEQTLGVVQKLRHAKLNISDPPFNFVTLFSNFFPYKIISYLYYSDPLHLECDMIFELPLNI